MTALKKLVAALISVSMMLSLVAVPLVAADGQRLKFKDVTEKDWYFESVKYASDNKIVNGIAPDLFAPERTMSRAMAVTMLYRMAGSPAVTGNTWLNDVKKGSWYYDAVVWAYRGDIVNGYSITTFAPDNEVTRAEFATMLVRYASHQNLKLPGEPDKSWKLFSDDGQIPSYAKFSVDVLVGAGVISGMTADTFVPNADITRAQAVKMIYMFARVAEDQPSDLFGQYGIDIEAVHVYSDRMPIVVVDAGANRAASAGSNYLLVSLSKALSDDTASKITMTAKLFLSYNDTKGISVPMKLNSDGITYRGDIIGLADVDNRQMLKVIIDIAIDGRTQALTFYPQVQIVY